MRVLVWLLGCVGLVGAGVLLYAGLAPRHVADAEDTSRPALTDSVQYWRAQGDEAYAERRWLDAIEAYEQVLERNAEDLSAWVRLAYSRHSAGQLDRALLAHQRVSRFHAARPWALYNIACVYAVKNEKDLALDYLHEAIASGFQSTRPIADDPDLQVLVGEAEFEQIAELAKPLHLRDRYRLFDFLVGRWYLVGEGKQRHGQLEMRRDATRRGMIGEYANNALPLRATIMAYFEPGQQRWRQLWLTTSGSVIDLPDSSATGNSIRLQGTWTLRTGEQYLARLTFDVSGGTASVKLERSRDNGTWWEFVVRSQLVPHEQRRPRDRSTQ